MFYYMQFLNALQKDNNKYRICMALQILSGIHYFFRVVFVAKTIFFRSGLELKSLLKLLKNKQREIFNLFMFNVKPIYRSRTELIFLGFELFI